jgi:acetyl-CoA carboxylase beta subunit
MLDMIVDRREMKDTIARLLRFSLPSPAPAAPEPAIVVETVPPLT